MCPRGVVQSQTASIVRAILNQTLSVSVGLDELLGAIRALVRDEMSQQTTPGYLDVVGAATYLSSTAPAIRALVKRNAIPVHRTPNGRLLFTPSELDSWVRQGTLT